MKIRLLFGWLLLLHLADRCLTASQSSVLIYSSPMSVQVWSCQDYDHWMWINNTMYKMVMVLPGDPNWNTSSNCTYLSGTLACNTPAPTPSGVSYGVQSFTWFIYYLGFYTYGKYYTCLPGMQTLSGAPGILQQCINGIWNTNSASCVTAPPELPVIAYNSTVTPMRIWICPHYKFWLGNNYRMVMALSNKSTWNNPGNCQNDMTLSSSKCNSYAPPPSGAHVVQNFTWNVPFYMNSMILYGVYYECNSGNLTASGYPGILMQCLNAVWQSTPIDSCIQATTPPPVILYQDSTVRVWGCQTLSLGLGTSNRMVIAGSSDYTWSSPGICTVTNDTNKCTTNIPQPVNAQVVQNFIWNTSSSVYGVYYECNNGWYLASGSPGLLTQCVAGTWTFFSENCIPAPRDCCDLRNNNSSIYGVQTTVIAVGNNIGTIQALCDMGQEPGSYEGGWTLVLWHSTQSSDDLQLNLSSYTVGYGQPNINAPKSYFIGLQYLAALNWNSNTVRPLVMKIVMVNQSSTLHATYGNLVINKNDGKYTLNSLGDYQGNSGDYLTGSVGRAFCAYGSSPDFCWWGNPGDTSNNLLTGDRPQWGNSDLTSVMVWVRSQTCDDALACPPMNTFNLPDESVVPLSRAPNTTFPYNCVGDLMMARKVDGTKSPAGQVTCVPASNGSPLKWDTVFPCVLVCPSNFVLSYNGTSCYYFSTTRASMGHTDALTRCAAMNATLAFITDPRDMQTANNSIYYLTAFTIRRNGAIFPDIGSFQAHGFDCDLKYLYCPGQRNGEDLCIILNNGGHLNLTNCYNNMYYACMRPGMCPPGYTLYRSRCYKVITKNQFSNFLDALDTCNYDGAALAYPQDTDFLNYLVKFAQSHITWSSPTTNNIAIGFNNIWDNLTINNIYAPSTDVINAVKSLTRSTTSNCTFLNVSKNSDQWVLTPTSINTTFTYAICEFRGPQGCWESVPYYQNFSMYGSLPGNTVNQMLNYSCWPGYYVNGVVGSEWPQYLWCYGQLGGWFPRQPPLDPCIGIDVCNETFPPAPPGIVRTPDTNPRYETHKLTYDCAANGMSNLVGQSSQKLVCTKYNESYYNYVGPNITECQRCYVTPLQDVANTTSLSSTVWTIGQNVTVTCNYGYQVSHNVSTQVITCTSNSWQFLPCQKVCLEVPVVRNATTDWVDNMWTVNEKVTATCIGNLYFASLKSKTWSVTCMNDGTWDNSTGCDEVCLDNAVVVNATVDLQGKYWLVGSTVPAVCNANHMFLQEENNTVSIKCTSLGWENRTGCALVCDGKPNLQQANTDWNSTGIYPVGSTVTATCLSGYLLPGGGQEYQVECTDSGWNVTVMCKKACTDEPQVVNATTNYTSSGAWLVGSFVYAVCQENFTFTKYSSSSRRVNCTLTGWDNTPPCEEIVPTYPCNVPPEVTNANTSWINKTWTTGEKVNVTCLNLYYFSDFTQQQQLQCLEGGWENITGCQKPNIVDKCSIEPVVENATIAWENRTWLYGNTVMAKCFSGYMFVAENVTELPIVCTNEGWQNQTGCQAVCKGEPNVEGANINVSTKVWLVGETVNATCLPGLYLIPNASQSQLVECLMEGWQNVTACEAACVEEPDYENANWVWDYEAWKVGESLPANCTDQHLTKDGFTNTSFSCTSNGWLTDFPCLTVCEGEPVVNNATTTWKSGMWLEGKKVTAKCKPHNHFSPKVYSATINCTNQGWENTTGCVYFTDPPSSGLLYPPLPDFPVAYAQTATYYWGTIDNNMTWVPSTPPVPQIKGPFGFGTGVNMSISRHQCLVHKGYNVTVDQCSANPANCTLGFSLSVWINVNITQNYFDSINDTTGHLTTFQTIVSTGGDTNGHPGVRLSLYGVWIYALLSTGNLYWEASTIGQFGTRNWTNIGIRWAPPSLNDSGLEVFVNQKKQAQTMSPQTAAASKSALNPPQMMVGCHMDADNTTYRNYADALIDELATWTKELNDTETLYFTGGYAWEFANQTAESFASQVSGADMNDPETAATVINGLQNMIADQTTQNSMPSPTQATSATTAGTQASPTAVPPTTALTDFQTLLNVVNTITKGGNAPQNITATQCNKILSLYGAVSNLFSVNNVGNIEAIQERKDNAGSAQVMENVANWTSALIRQVRYVNTTIPLNFTQVTDNILMMAIKRNLSEWRASGQAFIVSPNYSTLSLSSLWDYPYDRAAVPVGLVSDPDCGNRAINVQVISSRTYDLTAFTLVNVARMPDSDYYEVGSHTLTVRVDCDPPTTNNTNYTKAADECQPTPEALLNNPIRLKLRHTIVESYVTRSLKFHDQERKKTILHRYCVWWNPALSDFGVWDSTGCYILETTDKYTKCACAQLGTFAIMALQTEPKVVPVDAVWLTVLRYIGYGLSFLFIIIYILVVAFSSDLKDQFHLMGANLAVGVLMGTVFMVVSDLNSVRSSRHSCTAVGTLLHLFYQGAGAAVFTLGHASFNAITSGVIGGLLRAYLPISWGLPLISVGLTYLLFLFDLGEDPRCFISWENSPKYVFFGFQMFFVFFSFIHASIVLCNVSTPALRKDNLIDDYGSFCRGAAYVTLFFDLTWVFGLLCYLHLGFTEPDFYPIFQVLNSWTGLVVFLFIGMGSRRFKMVVAGQAHLRRQMLFGNAFGTSSAVPEYKEVLNTPEDEYNGAIESTPSDKSSPVTNSQLQVQRAQDKAPFLPPPSPVPGQID